MMKKISFVLVLVVLVASSFVFVSAREQERPLQTAVVGAGQDDVVAYKESIRLRAMNADNLRDCVGVMRELYPDTDERRLELICENLMDARLARTTVQSRVDSISTDVSERLRATLSATEQRKLSLLGRSGMKDFEGLSAEQIRARLSEYEVVVVSREEYYHARSISVDRKDQARVRYQEAVSRYEAARNGFEGDKAAWQSAVREGRDDDAVRHAQAFLMHALNLIEHTLTRLEAQADSNTGLSEDEFDVLMGEIESMRVLVLGLRGQLEAAQTKEDVKLVGSKIMNLWDSLKTRIGVQSENMMRANVYDILKRSLRLEVKLEELISELEEQGFDTSSLDAMMEKFSDLLLSARTKLGRASNLMLDARLDADREKLHEARELIRSAHQDLRNAHEALKLIWAEIRSMGWEHELEDSSTVEVIVGPDDVLFHPGKRPDSSIDRQ